MQYALYRTIHTLQKSSKVEIAELGLPAHLCVLLPQIRFVPPEYVRVERLHKSRQRGRYTQRPNTHGPTRRKHERVPVSPQRIEEKDWLQGGQEGSHGNADQADYQRSGVRVCPRTLLAQDPHIRKAFGPQSWHGTGRRRFLIDYENLWQQGLYIRPITYQPDVSHAAAPIRPRNALRDTPRPRFRQKNVACGVTLKETDRRLVEIHAKGCLCRGDLALVILPPAPSNTRLYNGCHP